MIGYKGPTEDILNPKPNVTSANCPSTHGGAGFLQGTTYDATLGVYVCPCGRQYQSNLSRPDFITEYKSYQTEGATEMKQGYIGPATTSPMLTDTQAAGKSLDWPNGHPA